MKRLPAELLKEFFPTSVKLVEDNLELLTEAVLFYHGVYNKAAILIGTGERTVSDEDRKAIFAKEERLDFLNQLLQNYKKEPY